MARQRFAPTHDVCAAARFVPMDDTAWDHERIKAECDEIRKAAKWTKGKKGIDPALDPKTGHVWHRYHSGMTRFQLEAEGVIGYLDMTMKPEMFKLQRISLADRAEVTSLLRMRLEEKASQHAYLKGVVGLENAVGERGRALAAALAAKNRNDQDILDATENYAAGIIGELSTVVMMLSEDLTQQEKKASDSPAGEPS